MRDRNDNVVIVCSIENVDPMGVHTGDSVTVAPAQTLTDPLYQELRDQAIAVIRAIGVETGGSNVQFARQPRERRDRRDRDEPARLALLGARLEGDRLPDREDGGEAGGRLRARGDPQRHHARHAGLLRADDRLRRDQDAALRLREVPRRRRAGSRPTCRASARRWRSAAPSASPSPRRCARASSTSTPELPDGRRGAARRGSRRPAPERFDLVLEAFRRGIGVEAVHERCLGRPLVPARARGARQRGRRHRGPRPHLQGGRHLRRRVRGRDALLLLGARARRARRRASPPRCAAASATRS